MKKLTKKQRHDIFIEALKEIERGNHSFMCNAIEAVLRRMGINVMFDYFDEISKETNLLCPENYKQDCYSCVTADVYNEGVCIIGSEARGLRLMILQFCIEMTK